MKYYFDTEFIEGFTKPVIGKKRHFIDLISIGIVAEDGREYYAISKEFNPNDANDWVKENVISKLPERLVDMHDSPSKKQGSLLWKSNKQIRQDIISFVCDYETASEYAGVDSLDTGYELFLKANPPEFYAYYADYDWVVFCSLFGRMIDLPKGFPMYCRDLKQMIDSLVDQTAISKLSTIEGLPVTHEMVLNDLKKHPDYPKQDNEHDALDDARWNRDLHQFIININKF